MVIFEALDNALVHVSELRTVALVEDQDNMLFIDIMLLVFSYKDVQFLDRSAAALSVEPEISA